MCTACSSPRTRRRAWGACKKFERDFYLIGDESVEAARFFRRSEVLALGGTTNASRAPRIGTERSHVRQVRWLCSHAQHAPHDEGRIDLSELIGKLRQGRRRDYIHVTPPHRRVPFPLRPSVRAVALLPAPPHPRRRHVYMKLREGMTLLSAR